MKIPKVIVPPVEEPITIDEARSHLEAVRYGDSTVDDADDAMIDGWLSAAREYCEAFTGLSFATKTLEIALDRWPTVRQDRTVDIDLYGGPVREILEISVGELGSSSSSDANLVDPDAYVLDTFSAVARITPVSAWPTVTEATNTIRVRYLAGYGADSDGGEALPKQLRAAILLVLGHLYANRESSTDKPLTLIPLGVESLLRPYRVRVGHA